MFFLSGYPFSAGPLPPPPEIPFRVGRDLPCALLHRLVDRARVPAFPLRMDRCDFLSREVYERDFRGDGSRPGFFLTPGRFLPPRGMNAGDPVDDAQLRSVNERTSVVQVRHEGHSKIPTDLARHESTGILLQDQ